MPTVSQLAAELGIPQMRDRQRLRRNRPRPADANWTRYQLTTDDARAVRAAFAARAA